MGNDPVLSCCCVVNYGKGVIETKCNISLEHPNGQQLWINQGNTSSGQRSQYWVRLPWAILR
ncbi:hypothetical protein EQJ81_14610 [Salmonella enterica]|nr:hypothetical protein [Salmonella enterica subsp. enterica serovar Thompson]EAA7514768.1 hypothetical protein [Salmonella enterica]ECF6814872.1 hypothetical protein [Salmonella enterica subsp. enterica]EAB1495186.1 hypothetical protein [Salmonella enterica]EAB4405804.1 hypothetical protein [Salmonella enterica]